MLSAIFHVGQMRKLQCWVLCDCVFKSHSIVCLCFESYTCTFLYGKVFLFSKKYISFFLFFSGNVLWKCDLLAVSWAYSDNVAPWPSLKPFLSPLCVSILHYWQAPASVHCSDCFISKMEMVSAESFFFFFLEILMHNDELPILWDSIEFVVLSSPVQCVRCLIIVPKWHACSSKLGDGIH